MTVARRRVETAHVDQDHRFSIAPMMDWTDRHCRAFHRVLTRRARLYTEMITAQAIVHGDRRRLLGYDDTEHPVALQLGGSDPVMLAEAARIGEDFGFDEINLNVGCPSDRVKTGRFGACLMREPELVAACMAAIVSAVRVPATVKCRIGVDDQDPDRSLFALVDRCAAVGVTVFVVHARKAWLQGLSPKENREVPPLDYGLVHRLKAERPALTVVINGGLASVQDVREHLLDVDGAMLGRAAYHSPAMLGQVDRLIFGEVRSDIAPIHAIEAYRPYIARALAQGVSLHAMTRHLLGLFSHQPGARRWRRILTEEGVRPGADLSVLDRALEGLVDQGALAAAL